MKTINRIIKSALSLLLTAMLLMQTGILGLYANGLSPSFLGAVSNYDVMLQAVTGSSPNEVYTEVKNGDNVSFNDLLRMVYNVTIEDNSAGGGKLTNLWDSINSLATGTQYYIEFELPIPDGLVYKDSEKNISINIGTDSVPNLVYFATLYPATDGSGVFLRFKKEGFWVTPLASTEEVEAGIYVTCVLDDKALDGKTDAVISLEGAAIVNIELTDGLPDDHTLVKNAALVTGSADANSNQMIEWTVEYHVGSDMVTPPITFYDTFDSKYNTYVVGSFSIKTSDSGLFTTVAPIVEHSTNSDMIALSYVYNKAVVSGQKITFKYRTMLTNEALYGDADNGSLKDFYAGTLTLENHSEMRVRDTMFEQANADIEITPSERDKHWLAKKVTNADQSNMIYGTDIISWEVDVRAFDLGFETFFLYDTIPDGLTLLDDTVKISVDGGITYQKYSDYGVSLTSVSASPGGVGTAVPAFKLELPTDSNGVYYQSYRVIYDTRVSTVYMCKVDSEGYIIPSMFDNIAWLEFTWPSGTVPYKPKPPVVELTGVGVDVPILLKSGEYNASTHRIKWTVEVNPFGIDIVNGTITDFFTNTGISSPSSVNDRNMVLLPETFSSEKNSSDNDYFTLNPGYDVTDTAGMKAFSVTVNGLATNTAVFTFDTEVLDEKNTEYNSNRKYTNNADFSGQIKIYNTNGDFVELKSVKDTSAATPDVKSTVLAKSSGTYDYTTNTIKWTVTVNQNKMPMTGAYIVDTIPKYLYVDTDTINVTAAGIGTFAINNWSWDYTVSDTDATQATEAHAAASTTSLKVDLGDISNQTATITYKTKLLVEDPMFKKTYSLTVENNAILERSGMAPTVAVKSSQSITNTILDKTGAFVKNASGTSTSTIDYTVKINPHGMDLNGYTLIDTLPKGLELDIGSVKLWKATVSSGGVITKTNTEAVGYTFEYQYSSGTKSFTIKLPGDDPYVLTYSCIVVYGDTTGSTFTNTIAFKEPDFDGNTGAVSSGLLSYGGWALSRAKGSLSLKITKRDSKDETKLQNVKFQLLAQFSGNAEPTVIMESMTDANGELTFYPLNFLRDYWIKEVSGIEGYTDTSTAFAVDSSKTRYELGKYSLYMFTADAENDMQSVEIDIYNDRDVFDFSFFKVDNKGQFLPNAQFKITDKDDANYTRTATSGSNGVVSFMDIRWGTYTLAEIKAPRGYYLNSTVYTVEIDTDGNYRILDDNNQELKNSGIGEAKIMNTKSPSSSSDGTTTDPNANTSSKSANQDTNPSSQSDSSVNQLEDNLPDPPTDPSYDPTLDTMKTNDPNGGVPLPQTGSFSFRPVIILLISTGLILVVSGILLKRALSIKKRIKY